MLILETDPNLVVEFVNEVAIISACVQMGKQLGHRNAKKNKEANVCDTAVLTSGFLQGIILPHLRLYCELQPIHAS
jgi:hypothetical protein